MTNIRLFFLLVFLLFFNPVIPEKWAVSKSIGVQKVVIDAGHGGIDPGNLGTGRYKSREKDVALKVALKVGSYIKEQLPDVEVIYTRTTDKSVELHERAAIANREKADLFISIHCDAFTSPQAFGSSSFVLGREHGDRKMRVAIQENSVISLEDNFEEKYEGFDPNRPETYIALSLYQNAFLEQSVDFAQKVQDEFRDRAKRKDRGVKQAPLLVTSRTSMPAVLIELGFLTNHSEEDFLQSTNGQEILASAIFRAFRSYKKDRDILTGSSNAYLEAEKKKIEEQKRLEEEEKAKNAFFYTVQIVTSSQETETKPENFSGLEDIMRLQEGRLYKYQYGKFALFSEAEEARKRCVDKGYTDAFIAAYANGRRIGMEDARRMERKNRP